MPQVSDLSWLMMGFFFCLYLSVFISSYSLIFSWLKFKSSQISPFLGLSLFL